MGLDESGSGLEFLGLLNHSTGAWEHHLTAHPDEHDARTMKKLIDFFKEPCLLLADRAFCSYEIILRLRDVKTTMGMESLDVRTPEMARKALAMALLGYNLVKAVTQEASIRTGKDQRVISFKGVLDWINCTTELFRSTAWKSAKHLKELYESFLQTASTKLIDFRPYRWEPRAKKKRPKPFPWLKESRKELNEKYSNGKLVPALS